MPATPNERPPSTTSQWKIAKIRVRPAGPTAESPAGRRLQQLALRNRRKPLQITVTYRGGPESWWELRARGKVVRCPGHWFIEDALSQFDGTLRKKS